MVLLACLLTAPAAHAQFSGGTGVQKDPYQVTTPAQLSAVNDHLDKHFILMNDLDLTDQTYNKAVIAPAAVGGGTTFTGSFNGNGKAIRHLTISGGANDTLGLFGSIGASGHVFGLALENVNVNGFESIGGLAGSNAGRIDYCRVSGTVGGVLDVGGLVGSNTGTIEGCRSMGQVIGSSYIGGLAGVSWQAISRSFSSANVNASGQYAGGLVGYNLGTLTDCYARGSVEGTHHVGGLAGRHAGAPPEAIAYCYSTGEVSGTDFFGGLVGSKELAGDPLTSFWDSNTSLLEISAIGTGKTSPEMKNEMTFTDAGWDFTAVWWMPETDYPSLAWQYPFNEGTGAEDDPYLIYTQQQLKAVNDDLAAHYRLMNDLDLSGAYPYAVIAPYIVSDSPCFTGSFDGNYRTIRNLMIHDGTVDYAGLFGRIGAGGSVSRLQLEVDLSTRSYVGGLAGLSDGTVIDCRVTGTLIGAGNYVGGLIGWNNGLIGECHGAALVQGNSYVGGLAGSNLGKIAHCQARRGVSGAGSQVGGLVGSNTGSISECFARGTVTATGNNAGGLAGLLSEGGSITASYARGAVTGAQHVGGLLGRNVQSPVTRCFSTGTVLGSGDMGGLVGSIMAGGDFADIDNIWDTQSSVWDTSAMGTASTTVPMKTETPFRNWNFTLIWALDADRNDGYPHLRQNPPAQAAMPAFDPCGGMNTPGIMTIDVMLVCLTIDAMIHYTTDGSVPTDADPWVNSGASVAITLPATLKARATAPAGMGLDPSAVHSDLYDGETINGVHLSWLAERGFLLDGSQDFIVPPGKTQDVRTHFFADLVVEDVNSIFRILALERASPITVTFSPSSAERLYRLEYTDDLYDDYWMPVAGQGGCWQTGDAVDGILQDTESVETGRFYRVQVVLPIAGPQY